MKTFATVVCALAVTLAPLVGAASDSKTDYPPHGTGFVRPLPTSSNGRTYQLHVSLPSSWAGSPDRRYPVLYLTDGYWDFPTVVSTYYNLVYDKVVPEIIIVGLGYAGEGLDYGVLRGWELSPVSLPDSGGDSGHAASFLEVLETEIIPLVERDYRGDPEHRALAGSSLGGLFALYAMYARPSLFEGFIAASPAAVVSDDWLFGYEDAFARSKKPLNVHLFMTGAENEWPTFLDGIKRFDARIRSRSYEGMAYKFRLIDGERHAGTKAESYTRGLRYIFEPLAPETGPSTD